MRALEQGVKLSAELVESFSAIFLSPLYDEPKPTPAFHRDVWAMYCSEAPACAVAAPRNHAKSTSLTHDFALATALFRTQDYIIILGASEELASEHLNDITAQLTENDDLIREFGIKRFISQTKTDIVVECVDGHQFRFIARGTEQKIRGRKWRGKRPGLILGDDIEDDEQVESRERRTKVRRWLFRAAKQALRDGGRIRIHGTILHEDSLLANLIKNGSWLSLVYKAHQSFDDFSNILWPEKFPEARLKAIQKEFIDNGDAPGYSQEYLNDPLDNSEAYLHKDDFVAMGEEDYASPKIVCAAADFAISKKDAANRTSFTIGGKDGANRLNFLDQRVGRWDSDEIIKELFAVQRAHNPDVFFVEGGQIWLALQATIYKEMGKVDSDTRLENKFINFEVRTPISDKASRGRALQKRMRARACRFDKQAEWYPGFEHELLRFTGIAQAALDDQFDSAALLALGFETLAEVEPEEDFMEEEEYEMRRTDPRKDLGRSVVTGY